MTGVQVLTDAGEWVDVGPVREVKFEPTEPGSASERVTVETPTEWSMTMNYVGGDASPLRDLFERLEREARWKRWSERLWLRAPYWMARRLAGHVFAPLGVELLPWQKTVMDAALSGKPLTIDWGRRG